MEKFSPHEALLEISNADGLNDTSLASAFPLHAGAPAVSNIKLDEITEDAEEQTSPPRPRGPQHVPSHSSMSSRKAALERSALYKLSTSPRSTPPPALRVTSDDGQVTESADVGDHDTTVETKEDITPGLVESFPAPPKSPRAHREPIDTSDPLPDFLRSPDHKPTLSKETIDVYQYTEYKPKVKLGPRPVNVSDKRRGPQIAGANGRPTSALPAGMQVRTKSAESTTLKTPDLPPKLADSPMTADVTLIPILPPPPPVPVTTEDSFPPRPSSRGSARSTPTRKSKGSMTPEKKRLLKAVEMRKKQMREAHFENPIQSLASPLPDVIDAVKQEAANESAPRTAPGKSTMSAQSARKSDSGVDMGYDDHADRQDSAAEDNQRKASSHIEMPAVTGHSQVEKSLTDQDIAEEKNVTNAEPSAELTPFLQLTDEPSVQDTSESEQGETDEVPTSLDTPDLPPDSAVNHRTEEQQKRRQGLVLPSALEHGLFINTDNDPASDDDDFMDELQDATVQEATPIAISATPFPRRASLVSRKSSPSVLTSSLSGSPKSPGYQPTISHAVEEETLPAQAVDPETPIKPQLQRSLSELSPSPQTQTEETLSVSRMGFIQPKILQSVDDLVERSSIHGSQASPKSPSSAFSALDPTNTTLRKEGQAAELMLRGSGDHDPNITRDRSRSHGMLPVSRYALSSRSLSNDSESNGAVYTVHQNPHSPRDSVSVTARIVRAAQQTDQSPHKVSDLHQSPITINHQRATPSHIPIQPKYPVLDDSKQDTAVRRDGTSSPSKQQQQQQPQLDGSLSPTLNSKSPDGKRRSFSRYQRRISAVSETHSEATTMPTMEEEPQKSGRASRFLKRMSTLGSRKKSSYNKESQPHSFAGDSLVETQVEQKDVPPAVVIGDVNVQFPDSGLWKRRGMEIDDAGNILFITSRHRFELGSTKRFHLSDFDNFHVPTVDDQELAHSVILTLNNKAGSAILCSCEDGMAQQQLLDCKLHHTCSKITSTDQRLSQC